MNLYWPHKKIKRFISKVLLSASNKYEERLKLFRTLPEHVYGARGQIMVPAFDYVRR